MARIKIAIAGVGNCASSLVQGIHYYRRRPGETAGLAHPELGGWRVGDIEVVAAFDIDRRKVGRPLHEAIFSPPNNARLLESNLPASEVIVKMGSILDGVAPHMAEYPAAVRFDPADGPPVDVAAVLRESGATILVNYMPVGAARATRFYAEACLASGTAMVNCVPEFIVSDPAWARRFEERGIPCIGDDVKSQLGATITHRTLARLFVQRGIEIDATYQLNTGGNTDILNKLDRRRLESKRISKTQAVQSQLDIPLDPDRIHIGPSDYVPFLKDNKVCFVRIQGAGFAGAPVELELRLSVEDSPNSGGVVVDAIRCCQIARDAKIGGPIVPACAWTMKHPPVQMADDAARAAVQSFVREPSSRVE
jgi:myo-inositol-1-phosphate synthase